MPLLAHSYELDGKLDFDVCSFDDDKFEVVYTKTKDWLVSLNAEETPINPSMMHRPSVFRPDSFN
jgi:hypothetical protein